MSALHGVTVRLLASRKSLVPIFFKVSVDQLFDNPESGKRNYRFGKKSRKILNFGSKNLYEPNPDSTYSET